MEIAYSGELEKRQKMVGWVHGFMEVGKKQGMKEKKDGNEIQEKFYRGRKMGEHQEDKNEETKERREGNGLQHKKGNQKEVATGGTETREKRKVRRKG